MNSGIKGVENMAATTNDSEEAQRAYQQACIDSIKGRGVRIDIYDEDGETVIGTSDKFHLFQDKLSVNVNVYNNEGKAFPSHSPWRIFDASGNALFEEMAPVDEAKIRRQKVQELKERSKMLHGRRVRNLTELWEYSDDEAYLIFNPGKVTFIWKDTAEQSVDDNYFVMSADEVELVD